MTENKTNEINRHQPNYHKHPTSDTAILLVHGIFASPIQFNDTAKTLYDAGYSVKTILLPGHGADVDSFAKATVEQWKDAVGNAIDDLSKDYSKIVLIGHSLGSLLVIDQSICREVLGVVLLSPPIKVKTSPTTIKMSMHILFADTGTDTDWLKAYRNIYSMDKCAPYQLVKCAPPLLNLLKLSNSVEKKLKYCTAPALIIHSSLDETVREKSVSILKKSLPNITDTLILKKSRHCYIDSSELEIYNNKILQFIDGVIK